MFRRLLGALGLSSDPSPATSSTPELSASAIVANSVLGSHVLTIDGYSQAKELLSTGKCAVSRPFTVAGHRWLIVYYPNGEVPEAANYISIYIKLHQHSMDVNARIKLSLLDKDGEPVPLHSCANSSGLSQVCTFTADKPSKGHAKLIDRTTLEASDYLQDDCFRSGAMSSS